MRVYTLTPFIHANTYEHVSKHFTLKQVHWSTKNQRFFHTLLPGYEPSAIALRELFGNRREISFLNLHKHSHNLAAEWLIRSFKQHRVILALPASIEHVIARWALWKSNNVVVPVDPSHPLSHLQYVIKDSRCSAIITDNMELTNFAKESGIEAISSQRILQPCLASATQCNDDTVLPASFEAEHPAMVVYTSGTTGKPKGVVLSRRAQLAQIASLSRAWAYSDSDNLLHTLPLHHVHGITNALECVLTNRGTVSLCGKFNPTKIWNELCNDSRINVFMAVPTMYAKLIEEFDKMDQKRQSDCMQACKRFRLMVSGSAALPEKVFHRWQEISGKVLLERYGMSEIGMALSNPLHGERIVGCVGTPMPSVKVKIIETDEQELQLVGGATECGELCVTGEQLFSGYLGRESNESDFVDKQWFRTGDIAAKYSNGVYRIVGRASADILKTAGFKVSALEIEERILQHEGIAECSVVGLADEVYGQVVTAIIIEKKEQILSIKLIRDWCAKTLSPYKVPRRILFMKKLPRNAMGKVNKKILLEQIDSLTSEKKKNSCKN